MFTSEIGGMQYVDVETAQYSSIFNRQRLLPIAGGRLPTSPTSSLETPNPEAFAPT